MLTMIYGTSCSGKSTIIHKMIENFGFRIVTCYTTRPLRQDDRGRVFVNLQEFQALERSGSFMFVNSHLDAHYGNKVDDIEEAIESPDKYLLDFLIKDCYLLKAYNVNNIILQVENEVQLMNQISSAGRMDRINFILNDYRTNYTQEKLHEYDSNGFKIFVNKYNDLDFAVNKILKYVNGNIY